jgi:hypothetical protein
VTAPAPEPATTLLVIAKEPVPGRVKTRLVPPCTHEQAAILAEAALADTLRTVLTVPARRRVLVLDGQPGPLTVDWQAADATAADAVAVAVARQAPHSRFAAQAGELSTVLSPDGRVTGGNVLGVTP